MNPTASGQRRDFAACARQFEIDAYLLAERPSHHPLAAHLEVCERCRSRLLVAETYSEEFRREVMPATVAVVVGAVAGERRAEGRRRMGMRAAGVLLSVAACAVLVLALGSNDESRSSDDMYLGAKGDVGLTVHCKRSGRVHQLSEGEPLRPGDALRFVPSLPDSRPRYVMIVSIDVTGKVSAYFPAGEQQAALVAQSGVPLPGSVILDDSEGLERLYLLAALHPFNLAQVQAATTSALSAAGALSRLGRLPFDAAQVSLFFIKERAPQ